MAAPSILDRFVTSAEGPTLLTLGGQTARPDYAPFTVGYGGSTGLPYKLYFSKEPETQTGTIPRTGRAFQYQVPKTFLIVAPDGTTQELPFNQLEQIAPMAQIGDTDIKGRMARTLTTPIGTADKAITHDQNMVALLEQVNSSKPPLYGDVTGRTYTWDRTKQQYINDAGFAMGQTQDQNLTSTYTPPSPPPSPPGAVGGVGGAGGVPGQTPIGLPQDTSGGENEAATNEADVGSINAAADGPDSSLNTAGMTAPTATPSGGGTVTVSANGTPPPADAAYNPSAGSLFADPGDITSRARTAISGIGQTYDADQRALVADANALIGESKEQAALQQEMSQQYAAQSAAEYGLGFEYEADKAERQETEIDDQTRQAQVEAVRQQRQAETAGYTMAKKQEDAAKSAYDNMIALAQRAQTGTDQDRNRAETARQRYEAEYAAYQTALRASLTGTTTAQNLGTANAYATGEAQRLAKTQTQEATRAAVRAARTQGMTGGLAQLAAVQNAAGQYNQNFVGQYQNAQDAYLQAEQERRQLMAQQQAQAQQGAVSMVGAINQAGQAGIGAQADILGSAATQQNQGLAGASQSVMQGLGLSNDVNQNYLSYASQQQGLVNQAQQQSSQNQLAYAQINAQAQETAMQQQIQSSQWQIQQQSQLEQSVQQMLQDWDKMTMQQQGASLEWLNQVRAQNAGQWQALIGGISSALATLL